MERSWDGVTLQTCTTATVALREMHRGCHWCQNSNLSKSHSHPFQRWGWTSLHRYVVVVKSALYSLMLTLFITGPISKALKLTGGEKRWRKRQSLFFDCFVRSFTAGKHNRKPFYRSPMDFRLNACVCKHILCNRCDRSLLPHMQWMKKEFISYIFRPMGGECAQVRRPF